MGLRLIDGPATEPVTLAEAKAHARIPADLTDDDAYVQTLIAAAREKVESIVARSFVAQTWEWTFDAFPYGGGYYNREIRQSGVGPAWMPGWYLPIELPRAPVQSVTSITYRDSTGAVQTLPPEAYEIVQGEPVQVAPVYGTLWPTVAPWPNAVAVTFVSGYATVPAVAKLAMLQLVSHWYSRREPIVTGTIVAAIPYQVESILDAIDWGAY